VSRFAENAAKIFDAAESAARSGHALSPMSVLIGVNGGIRLVADSDWSLESLRTHHGADMAFRVTGHDSRVTVEGRTNLQTCRLQSEEPARIARHILRSRPAHFLANPVDSRSLAIVF
jgi:hypothetical protein